ncbi:PDT-domain-containing protein [Lindgomyces ingoldianus]|uniref:PDT-domain-containing protein n=1 Tax=Lindgomyces ingoldianus TaxID=673940 RepID=A0ACB6R6K1_9PLEO|nr:PDT-domain-containing protein [Lindgomyces ingoldianus]KAF2474400.1 PDT-domain-containing protein [Lindgomyces ingoldianus]
MTEEKPVVAFLGPKASYTHQATIDNFPSAAYDLSPQITIEDVFNAVQNSTAYRGVVPFENSTNGSVVFTLDLFADLNSKYPDILVCGEAYVKVKHCLLGNQGKFGGGPSTPAIIESPLSSGAVTPTILNPLPTKPSARPIGDLRGIKRLYSHPQAWGQCKSFLNTYLKGVERLDVSSTSRAAEIVAGDGSGESAAISSGIAARIHGLGILARGIEDRGDNETRFFVIGRATTAANGISEHPDTTINTATQNYKSLISFTVDHNNPGALAHSLSVFEKYGLNLTSINTRPSGTENWNYIFFVEIKGRRLEDGEGEGAVNQALGDLKDVCRGFRWLGSWENRLGRER